MKNSAIPEEATNSPWGDALRTFDADLRRRGAADKTRRAYAVDLGQLAAWAEPQRLEPEAVTPRDLRRYAAHLGQSRPAPATVARKLAALRAFFRVLREHGIL